MPDEQRKPSVDDFVADKIEHRGGVIGNFIVVAEIVYEEGTTLGFSMSEHLPPWTAKGMLATTLEMLSLPYGEDMDFEEPEDLPGDLEED